MAEFIMLMEMDIPRELEAEFNRVYTEDHVPKLINVAGVLGVERYALEESDGANTAKYVALYRLTSPEIPKSKEWLAVADMGEWMPKIRPHTYNRTRSYYRRIM